jgi:hypothetical protein
VWGALFAVLGRAGEWVGVGGWGQCRCVGGRAYRHRFAAAWVRVYAVRAALAV